MVEINHYVYPALYIIINTALWCIMPFVVYRNLLRSVLCNRMIQSFLSLMRISQAEDLISTSSSTLTWKRE